MNIQQLEYIIAVDTCRHFVQAADMCFVTQATLSAMIIKLEEELGARIFDRSRQPVIPTETGRKIIAQARIVVQESKKLRAIAQDKAEETAGEMRIGIIPTLAPYLLPLFLQAFLEKYPKIKVHLHEMTTDEIVKRLEQQELDAGLLATPLHHSRLREEVLFYESFVVFASPDEKLLRKKYVLPADIDTKRLWLLEEGHCFHSQVVNLCELKKKEKENHQLDFAAGSIETLKKIVAINRGMTILPSMAVNALTAKEKKQIRYFKNPAPVREISLVTWRHFMKAKMLEALAKEIRAHIPEEMKQLQKKEIIPL